MVSDSIEAGFIGSRSIGAGFVGSRSIGEDKLVPDQ